jgi:hypothetical protein
MLVSITLFIFTSWNTLVLVGFLLLTNYFAGYEHLDEKYTVAWVQITKDGIGNYFFKFQMWLLFYRHNATEILLKVVFNTIHRTFVSIYYIFWWPCVLFNILMMVNAIDSLLLNQYYTYDNLWGTKIKYIMYKVLD